MRAKAMLCCFSSLIKYLYLDGANSVSGQRHEDQECPFSGVTSSDIVWRKVYVDWEKGGVCLRVCMCVWFKI